jgi:hypothetical protein
MSKQELRNLIIAARGEWVKVQLVRIGDTRIVAQGYENNPTPDWYDLFFEDNLVYSSENLDDLLNVGNYPSAVINEDEVDNLQALWFRVHDQW